VRYEHIIGIKQTKYKYSSILYFTPACFACQYKGLLREARGRGPGGRAYKLFWAHFLPLCGKKPGYPLQVLESADALSAGFPLLSLAQSPPQKRD
jgi:hypothetical protein